MQDLDAHDPRSLGGNTIIARLGAGGMGRVYLARSPGGRSLALKVIRSELSEDPRFRRRFAREVAAARAVSGAFTAAVVAADPDGDPAWLATTYIPAMSLAEVVDERGPLPEPEVRGLAAGLAEALQAIHDAGIIHRDLKPSNVLLAEDGPRVIDFGIAAATEASVITRSGHILGTPAFMSPEQVTGSREVGPASDVFSLGALLVFASTGRLPFGSGQPHAVMFRIVHERPDLERVPASVTDLVTRCLAKEPDDRPSVRDILAALSPSPPVRDSAEQPGAASARSGEIHSPAEADEQAATRATRRWSFLPKTLRTTRTSQRDASTVTRPNPDPAPRVSAPARITGPTRRLWMYEATSPIRWCRSDGTTFYVAEQRGRLTALDPATGTPRWRFPSDGHFHSGDLAFSDGAEQIYLSTSTGIGYYLDAMTGRVRWRHDYRDTPYGFHTAGDPPPPEGRSLVSGWHVAIRNGAEVHALDTKNGRKRWRFSPAGHEPHFPPIGDVERISTAGGLLLAEYRHSLHAIDIRSGNPAWSHWSFARQGYLYSWTLGGTVLVYDRSRELLALDLRTGQELWHFPCRLDGRGQVTPGRDTLFVLEENEIQRVDPATGRRTWRWSPPSQTRTLGVSAIEDDLIHVWLHGYGDTLNALRISSKELMWSHEAVRHAGVIYSNEAMYFWDPNSSLLRSVGREDGRKKWEIQVGDPDSDDTRSAVGKPVIAGNVIACQSDSHRLCGVGPAY